MQNKIFDGRRIHITATGEIAGGQLIVLPGMVAVASADAVEDQVVACEVKGVFELGTDGSTIAQGQVVYATPAGVITATATGNLRAGVAWADNKAGIVLAHINF